MCHVSPLGQAQKQVPAGAIVETGNSEPAGLPLAVLVLGATLDTESVPHHLAAGRCGGELGLVGETADELHTGQRVSGRGREGAGAIEDTRNRASGEHFDGDVCLVQVQEVRIEAVELASWETRRDRQASINQRRAS